jgi:signal peptidase I
MRFFLVPSESMMPGLLPNDYLVTFRASTYSRGDVVVLYDPLDQTAGVYLVKRIVAVAGDRVRIEGGALFLNGLYASEPYIAEPMRYDFLAGEDEVSEYTVPEGEILVLGDNRNHSEDGSSEEWRTTGVFYRPSVPLDSIVGRVYAVYLPWSRMKKVIHFPLRNADGE